VTVQWIDTEVVIGMHHLPKNNTETGEKYERDRTLPIDEEEQREGSTIMITIAMRMSATTMTKITVDTTVEIMVVEGRRGQNFVKIGKTNGSDLLRRHRLRLLKIRTVITVEDQTTGKEEDRIASLEEVGVGVEAIIVWNRNTIV
jgi:hypothetical protein